MPCPIISRHKMQTQKAMQTPKMNVTTVKCLLANLMTMTCHMRHIFMPIDETIKKIFYLTQQFVKCNNSIPSNQNGLLQCK